VRLEPVLSDLQPVYGVGKGWEGSGFAPRVFSYQIENRRDRGGFAHLSSTFMPSSVCAHCRVVDGRYIVNGQFVLGIFAVHPSPAPTSTGRNFPGPDSKPNSSPTILI